MAQDDYSSFDHDLHRSALDDVHATRNDFLADWDSPYTPGTVSGEHYRWYETKPFDFDFLDDAQETQGRVEFTVTDIGTMIVLGISGAIALSLIF